MRLISVVVCEDCGWQGLECDVMPFGSKPGKKWGSAMECPDCHSTDNLSDGTKVVKSPRTTGYFAG